MSNDLALSRIFSDFNKLKILIIGDVMIDSYIWGKVERISPEAPVPIISINNKEIRLGGAGNVAKNIAALGAQPLLCSVIGKDSSGEALLKLLEKQNMSSDGIVLSKERMTTVKERVLSASQQLLRIDTEETKKLSPQEKKAILARIEQLIPEVDAIIFEDYDKGVIDKTLIEKVVIQAKAKGIPTVVDPKKRNFMHYRGVSLFKPNLKEIKEGLKLDFDASDNKGLQQAVEKLMSALQLEATMVTRSEHGVYYHNHSERHFIPAHLRSISDVSGAGDTVVSTATLCLALGLPTKVIAELSNLAGGLVCEHLGVVPIDKAELLSEAQRCKIL